MQRNSQEFKTKSKTQNKNMSGNWQTVQSRPQGQRNTFHRNRNGTSVEQQGDNRGPYRPRNSFRRNNGSKRQYGNRRPYRPRNGGNRRPYRQRNQQRRRQPRNVIEPNSIAAWGLSKDKSFKMKVERAETANRSGKIVSRSTSNQFAALNQAAKKRELIEGPTFGVRDNNIGAWGTKLTVEESDEPVKFKSLKEIEDEKEEKEYEEELEKETSRMTQLDPRNLFTPAVIGNWGDMAMEEDDEDYISTEYHAAEYTQQDGWYD